MKKWLFRGALKKRFSETQKNIFYPEQEIFRKWEKLIFHGAQETEKMAFSGALKKRFFRNLKKSFFLAPSKSDVS